MDSQRTDFEQASQESEVSLVREFLQFLAENKKWWLLPVLLVFGILGVFTFLASTGAAPFIYPF